MPTTFAWQATRSAMEVAARRRTAQARMLYDVVNICLLPETSWDHDCWYGDAKRRWSQKCGQFVCTSWNWTVFLLRPDSLPKPLLGTNWSSGRPWGALCQVLRSDCLSIYEKFRSSCPDTPGLRTTARPHLCSIFTKLQQMGFSINGGTQNWWFIMENPIKWMILGILGVYTPISGNLHMGSDGLFCCSQRLIPCKELETAKS